MTKKVYLTEAQLQSIVAKAAKRIVSEMKKRKLQESVGKYYCPSCGTELEKGGYRYNNKTGGVHVRFCPECDGSTVGMPVKNYDDAIDAAERYSREARYEPGSDEYNELTDMCCDFRGDFIGELRKRGYCIAEYKISGPDRHITIEKTVQKQFHDKYHHDK